MRLLYGASDEKYVKIEEAVSRGDKRDHHYTDRPFVQRIDFDRNALPIVFKVSPESLLNLAAAVVDKLPLSSIYEWSTEDVCRWIRKYGYQHYQNTFRVNLITGRKLLLVDAQALSSMNIKNFHDIQHIAYGIRQLFHFEMTKFMRSISLPRQFYYELYKLFRTKSGYTIQQIKRTDLWRRMQLIRKRKPYLSHWDLLEHWLARRETENPEIFGGTADYCLYRCKKKPTEPNLQILRKREIKCTCMPPCPCYITNVKQLGATNIFSLLKSTRKEIHEEYDQKHCDRCVPPCTCHWRSKHFKLDTTLPCLRENFPLRYGNRIQLQSAFTPAFSMTTSVYSFIRYRMVT